MGLVVVYQAGDEVRLNFAESLLRQAGICCTVRNRNTQNLIGMGTLGGGYNPIIGPMEILVNEADAKEATAILEPINAECETEAESPEGPQSYRRRLREIAAWGLLTAALLGIVGGILSLANGQLILTVVLSVFAIIYFWKHSKE